MDYEAHCPLCGAQLQVSPISDPLAPARSAGVLNCPNADYIVERSTFESLWQNFIIKSNALGDNHDARLKLSEQLLKDLQEANQKK